MKTIQFVCACFSFFLISCNNDSKPVAAADTASPEKATSSLAQKNLDAMHVVDKAFMTGDISGIDSVVDASFVDHTDKGDMNRDSLKVMIKMSAADKTMKMETIKEVADDEYAFGMMHMSGTGDGVSMPAVPYDMHSVEIVKFKNGKAIEHWSYIGMADAMKMMAGMQEPAKTKEPKKK